MKQRDLFTMKQVHHALELFAQSITDESTMMEIADVYPPFAVGKAYRIGDVFRYGVNADGETQLYQVLQAHTSAEAWNPAESPSLYKSIGITDDGMPIWTQPLGASDAYAAGDRVEHRAMIWESDVNGNVWEPGVYGWTEVHGDASD